MEGHEMEARLLLGWVGEQGQATEPFSSNSLAHSFNFPVLTEFSILIIGQQRYFYIDHNPVYRKTIIDLVKR